MKAITPAKLIPPDHSTAASGTLPTEQTKLRIGDDRADDRVLDQLQPGRGVRDEQGVEEAVGELADEPGEQEADQDLLPHHRPVVAEVVRDIRPGARAREALADRHVLAGAVMLMAAVGLLGVLAGLLLQTL